MSIAPEELQAIAIALVSSRSDVSWALHRYAPPNEKEMLATTVGEVDKAYQIVRAINDRLAMFPSERHLLGLL